MQYKFSFAEDKLDFYFSSSQDIPNQNDTAQWHTTVPPNFFYAWLSVYLW